MAETWIEESEISASWSGECGVLASSAICDLAVADCAICEEG